MRKILKTLASVAAFAIGASAAQAKETFICDMTPYTTIGWISPKVAVIMGDGREGAHVYDGIIHEVYGEPIAASVSQRNARIFELTWTVNNVPLSNGVHTIDGHFRALFNVKKKKLHMSVLYNGMDVAQPRGIGECSLSEG